MKLTDIIKDLKLNEVADPTQQQVQQPQAPVTTTAAGTAPVPQEPNIPKLTREQKKKLVEMVGKFNEYGKAVYKEGDLMEISKNIKEITELAETYALTESPSWFEKKTIERNMTEIKKKTEQFCKLASEIAPKQHELEAIFQEIGQGLNRYYSINEVHDPIATTQNTPGQEPAALEDPRTPMR